MATDYPTTLRVPQTENVTPFERAQFSNPDRPREARALSLDRLAIVRATWAPMSPAEAAIFEQWWRVQLYEGGAWFNATWPLPQGFVPAVFRFIEQPRWRFVPGGRWRVEAVLEQRGRGLSVIDGFAAGGPAIAWYEPIDDRFTGTLVHTNSGTGVCNSFAPGPVTQLLAGVIGWAGETVVWSTSNWTSGTGDAAPFISDSADGWVQIQWNNFDGWLPEFPFVSVASIGELILTCTVDGVPVEVGQRLSALTTAPVLDYSDIAWGPE